MIPLLKLDAACMGWSSPILGPLSLTLQAGEILGIQGPNGVGKSTLLSAITGVAKVFSGQLEIASGTRMALQTQQMPHVEGLPLNGHELLALTNSLPGGLPSPLLAVLDERLDRLSGGQRQFLCLWAVLNSPADLILLDEPSNNLDATGSAYLASALRARAAQGAGIVLVSHEQSLLAAACDRCIECGVESQDKV